MKKKMYSKICILMLKTKSQITCQINQISINRDMEKQGHDQLGTHQMMCTSDLINIYIAINPLFII